MGPPYWSVWSVLEMVAITRWGINWRTLGAAWALFQWHRQDYKEWKLHFLTEMQLYSIGHVTELGEKYCNEPGTEFSTLLYIFFCTGKLFCFFRYFNFHNIFLSLSHKLHHHCFPVWKKIIFSVIAPVISSFLEIVSCYFKVLKLLVILICIFNHPNLHSLWLLLPLNKIISEMHHCSIYDK